MTDRAKKKREETQRRKENNLCTMCGKQPPKKDYVRCSVCLEKINNKQKRLEEQRRCISCKRPTDSDHKSCEFCKTYHRDRRKNFKQEGNCVRCGRERTEDNTMCSVCYLKCTAKSHLGSSRQWKRLREIFEEQKGICPYSGIKLSLGKNTELDHVVSKFNGGLNEKENMQWLYSPVNKMKWTHDENEFLKIIKLVHDYSIAKS